MLPPNSPASTAGWIGRPTHGYPNPSARSINSRLRDDHTSPVKPLGHMLTVEELNCSYHTAHILHHTSIHLAEGEVLALHGRNGTGNRTAEIVANKGLKKRRSIDRP